MYCDYISKNKNGFSTIELLIAMAIMAICLTVIFLVSFGSQSIMVDSQTNSEAIMKAQEILEMEQAMARQDFKLVNPTATTTDGIYQKKIDVSTSSNPSDFFTKKVTATVSWTGEYNRTLSVQLSALVTNFENAVGGDTCDSAISPDWQPAAPVNYTMSVSDLLSGTGLSDDNYPITSVDVYLDKLYVAVSNTTISTSSTFFIFDISDPSQKPLFQGSLDNSSTTKTGINAVKIAGNYAYVASARSINLSDPTFGQLQIINISNPAAPKIEFNFPVLGITAGGVGRSVYYKDGYVYLGLSSTSGQGHEFNIIDVHKDPFPTGSFSVDSDVEAIYVKGNYAYLATDDHDKEGIILNVRDPYNPEFAGYFDAGGSGGMGNGDGNSLYLVGDNLYLGRTYVNNGPEFYVLDSSSPSTTAPTSVLGYNDVGPDSSNPFSLNGVIVRNTLAFLLLGSDTSGGSLQIFDISNPVVLVGSLPVATTSLPNGGAGKGGTAMDCEGNYIYVGSIDDSENGYISVITGQ